jgi:hypothetical protein
MSQLHAKLPYPKDTEKFVLGILENLLSTGVDLFVYLVIGDCVTVGAPIELFFLASQKCFGLLVTIFTNLFIMVFFKYLQRTIVATPNRDIG